MNNDAKQTNECVIMQHSDLCAVVQERLDLLQKMAEEHQMYLGYTHTFQSMLLAKSKELTELLERDDSAENRFQALRVSHDNHWPNI